MADAVSSKTEARRLARRRELLDAARELFVRNGYEQTSLDMIIAKTGGSRRNIYDLFGDKEGLFEAVMKDQMRFILERTKVPKTADRNESIRRQLEIIGMAFLQSMLDPMILRTMRQFVSIAVDRPDLGREAFKAGPAILYAQLETYLGGLVIDGKLELPDVSAAARILTEMLKGGLEFRALMTGDENISPDKIEDHVGKAVDLFLNGALPRQG